MKGEENECFQLIFELAQAGEVLLVAQRAQREGGVDRRQQGHLPTPPFVPLTGHGRRRKTSLFPLGP